MLCNYYKQNKKKETKVDDFVHFEIFNRTIKRKKKNKKILNIKMNFIKFKGCN